MVPCRHPPDQLSPRFSARDYITGDCFQIADCRACGCTITSPQPADLSPYYPATYYGSPDQRRFPKVVEWMQRQLYARRVRMVEHFASMPPGKVLDVGCGRGLLLQAFRERGWQVQGTEFSAHAARIPREALGLDVAVGDLVEQKFPSETFDAVTLWHVLEHVPDPRVLIAEISRILKPGGVLFLGIPNVGGWEARLCRDKWFHLDVPRHLNHLTRERLRQLLEERGFEWRASGGFSVEYDLFSFVQSFLNRCGLRHNLLYNLLRQGPAKTLVHRDFPSWQVPATLILGALLGLIGMPWILAAGFFQQGGTVTAVALKRK